MTGEAGWKSSRRGKPPKERELAERRSGLVAMVRSWGWWIPGAGGFVVAQSKFRRSKSESMVRNNYLVVFGFAGEGVLPKLNRQC